MIHYRGLTSQKREMAAAEPLLAWAWKACNVTLLRSVCAGHKASLGSRGSETALSLDVRRGACLHGSAGMNGGRLRKQQNPSYSV